MSEDTNAKNDLSDLFGAASAQQTPQKTLSASSPQQDLHPERFQKVTQLLGEKKKDAFPESTFSQIMEAAGGPSAKRFQTLFQTLYRTKDPQERSDTRNRLIPAFWELTESLSRYCKAGTKPYIRNFFRFGMAEPSLIPDEHRDFLSSVFVEKSGNETIFYLDEWLYHIATGDITPSDMDEVESKKKGLLQKTSTKINRMEDQLNLKIQALDFHNNKMESLENSLMDIAQHLQQRDSIAEIAHKKAGYTQAQKKKLSEISSVVRELSLTSRKLEVSIHDYEQAREQLQKLQDQEDVDASDAESVSSFDMNIAISEMRTLHQMIKLCVGRAGNQFPILSAPYFSGDASNTGFRENIINILAEIEYYDSTVFMRTHREITTRIAPNVILAPCYGDLGMCWTPFERFSRSTSRGRVVVPMYPRNLKIAVTAAIGDLRWQMAREKASRFWMEEGLTGWYYDYFTEHKLKGDIKQHFIRDYILWIQKESEGTQKLDKAVRSIFWRYLPFPQALKEKLKNRGYVYQELYKKDQNRALSSMY